MTWMFYCFLQRRHWYKKHFAFEAIEGSSDIDALRARTHSEKTFSELGSHFALRNTAYCVAIGTLITEAERLILNYPHASRFPYSCFPRTLLVGVLFCWWCAPRKNPLWKSLIFRIGFESQTRRFSVRNLARRGWFPYKNRRIRCPSVFLLLY